MVSSRNLHEDAAEAEHNGRAVERIIGDPRKDFGNAEDHRLNDHRGRLEARLPRVLHDGFVTGNHFGFGSTVEAHAAKVALVQEAWRLRLERNRLCEPPPQRNCLLGRRRQTSIHHGNPALGQRLARREKIR